jgi:hypothetical protein
MGKVSLDADETWTENSSIGDYPRSTATLKVGFGTIETVNYDSRLPACFIIGHPVGRWSPGTSLPRLTDTRPRLPVRERDTVPQLPVRVSSSTFEMMKLLSEGSVELLGISQTGPHSQKVE